MTWKPPTVHPGLSHTRLMRLLQCSRAEVHGLVDDVDDMINLTLERKESGTNDSGSLEDCNNFDDAEIRNRLISQDQNHHPRF